MKGIAGEHVRNEFIPYGDTHTQINELVHQRMAAEERMKEAQNEKNSGRYRMIASQYHVVANRGIKRTAVDRYRAAVIEQLLCQGRAQLGACLMNEARERLSPFLERGLALIDRQWLEILPGGLPYARSIAVAFDTYRQPNGRKFSSAV